MLRPIAVSFAATLVFGLVGCSPPVQSSAVAVEAASSVPPAKAAPVRQTTSATELVVTGPVTVEQQLDIVALRAGVITTLNADVDSAVERGRMLAQMDDRQLVADQSAAEYKVKSLEADLKNWEAEVEVRASDLRRAEAMRKEGINTQEAFDHTRYNLNAAQYEVERQRQEMLGAQATRRSLDLELEKTVYRAPFSGIVTQRYVRNGQYVTVGDKLFHLTGLSPLEVRFTLPGSELGVLKRGDLLTISSRPDFQEKTTAAVTHISPAIDPGSDTVEVTAVLRQPLRGLTLGTIASIRVPVAQ